MNSSDVSHLGMSCTCDSNSFSSREEIKKSHPGMKNTCDSTLTCTNRRMADVRSKFLEHIKKLCPQLSGFDNKNTVKYCFSMKDKIIQEPTANFAREIYESYKKEEKLPPLKIMCLKKIGMLRR